MPALSKRMTSRLCANSSVTESSQRKQFLSLADNRSVSLQLVTNTTAESPPGSSPGTTETQSRREEIARQRYRRIHTRKRQTSVPPAKPFRIVFNRATVASGVDLDLQSDMPDDRSSTLPIRLQAICKRRKTGTLTRSTKNANSTAAESVEATTANGRGCMATPRSPEARKPKPLLNPVRSKTSPHSAHKHPRNQQRDASSQSSP